MENLISEISCYISKLHGNGAEALAVRVLQKNHYVI